MTDEEVRITIELLIAEVKILQHHLEVLQRHIEEEEGR